VGACRDRQRGWHEMEAEESGSRNGAVSSICRRGIRRYRDRDRHWREERTAGGTKSSENSKANRIETMKGPAESEQICSVGRRKIAKKIAKNKGCYGNTLRPRSRMLLKVMKGG
jgi:hypothetical protein